MQKQKLILFDVDGVLIYPKAYKEAMIDSVNWCADQMGQSPVDLTLDEIHQFEANSITNEWESLPMCVSLLVFDAVQQDPSIIGSTIQETFDNICTTNMKLTRPDFAAFADEVGASQNGDRLAAHTAGRLLKARSQPEIHHIFDAFFGDVFDINTPTTQLFQTHTLGSTGFESTYGFSAVFEGDSYLLTRDTAHITEENINLLQQRDENVTIYTARPGTAPIDLDIEAQALVNPLQHPPEADYGAQLLGMTDYPLISGGRVAWLATSTGKHMSAYIKPSPVQALAAIGAAQTGYETLSLQAAVNFYEAKRVEGPLEVVSQFDTTVIVFEDSTGGIQAVADAVNLLRQAGFNIKIESVGVAPEANKKATLSQVATIVVDDVNEGLHHTFAN